MTTLPSGGTERSRTDQQTVTVYKASSQSFVIALSHPCHLRMVSSRFLGRWRDDGLGRSRNPRPHGQKWIQVRKTLQARLIFLCAVSLIL